MLHCDLGKALRQADPAAHQAWLEMGRPDRALFDCLSAEWNQSTIQAKLVFLDTCSRSDALDLIVRSHIGHYGKTSLHVLDGLGSTLREYAQHVIETNGLAPGMVFTFFGEDLAPMMKTAGLSLELRRWLPGHTSRIAQAIRALFTHESTGLTRAGATQTSNSDIHFECSGCCYLGGYLVLARNWAEIRFELRQGEIRLLEPDGGVLAVFPRKAILTAGLVETSIGYGAETRGEVTGEDVYGLWVVESAGRPTTQHALQLLVRDPNGVVEHFDVRIGFPDFYTVQVAAKTVRAVFEVGTSRGAIP